jgi:Zn-dependent protease with chaperone function
VPSVLKAIPLGEEGIVNTPEGKAHEKALRNIVSELSVAAGIQEPDIYVLPFEKTINDMATGLENDDTSIILTMGALKLLSRDELMGLLAHEFSHIVNNDTNHFTLMAGWLHGLMSLTALGFNLIKNTPRLFIFGLILGVIGLFGNFIGSIIRAAFSRTRERLADATATQFTRDPKSLASVLKKIGGQEAPKRTSVLRHPDFTHMCVAEAPSFWERYSPLKLAQKLLRSHPPLEDRVWELDPNWDGWYWDYEKNPVNYLAEQKPAPIQALPQTVKSRSVIIPML